MREIDQLRCLTAGRLLTLWRQSVQTAEEPMERALLCNASVLAESCRFQGEPVFPNPQAVLEELTPREMETLLRRLAAGNPFSAAVENPSFDQRQFERMRGS